MSRLAARPDAWWVPGAQYALSGLVCLLLALVLAIVTMSTNAWVAGEVGTFAFALSGAALATVGCVKLGSAASA